MIFYEVTVLTPIPKTHVLQTKAEANKVMRRVKRKLVKDKATNTQAILYRCKLNNDLSKKDWLRLLASDAPGLSTIKDDNMLFVRDLIIEREQVSKYTCRAGSKS